MKNTVKAFVVGMVLGSLSFGCTPVNESLTTGSANTSMRMTGSSAPAVANSSFSRMFDFILPSARALTPPLLVDSNGATVNLSEAWVVIKQIEFEATETAGAAETDGDEVEFTGPFYVDLLSDAPVSFGDAAVPMIGIRRVKMQLHQVASLPASAPAGLNGNSMYFSGAVNGHNFSFASSDSTEFKIAGPNAIVPSSSQDMLMVIRMADLLKKIDLSAIVADTNIHEGNRVNAANPCPLISASASDLYTCFRVGLETEGDFGNDDGDLDLDASDDTVK